MKNEKKLSIVVPMYNVEKYLSKCLDSLAIQYLDDYEVILVNDGSKDGSKDIALEYVGKYKQFCYYEKPNGGLSDARNFGLEHSLGEFIAFIDADDYVDASMFVKMLNKQHDTNADIVACDMLYVYEDGRNEVAIAGNFEVIDVKNNLTFIDINNSACNKLFRTSLFNDIRFPIGKLYEDLFIVPILVYKANKVARVDEPLYMYYQRSGSIVHANNPNMFHIYEAIDNVRSELLKKFVKLDELQPIINGMLIKHGLFLTTLRIKNNGTYRDRIRFFKLNMDALNKRYIDWHKNPNIGLYPLKSRIIFSLLYLRLFPVVALIL